MCLIRPRNEIASCEEVAYDSLPLKDATTLLFFNSQSELLKFAQEVFCHSSPFPDADSHLLFSVGGK